MAMVKVTLVQKEPYPTCPMDEYLSCGFTSDEEHPDALVLRDLNYNQMLDLQYGGTGKVYGCCQWCGRIALIEKVRILRN